MQNYIDFKAAFNQDEWREPCPIAFLLERRMCACGQPELVYRTLVDALDYLKKYREECERAWDEGKSTPEGYALKGMREITQDEARMLTLYMLDMLGLTEHGSSVNGSWLDASATPFVEDMKAANCGDDLP